MPPFPHRPAAPGLVLRTSGNSGPQLARGSNTRFTPEAQAVFLDHLAASCNVSWSAVQAGISTPTAYNHRRANPAFAREWEEALRHGYVRLETELVGTAIEYAARLRSDDDLPLKHMSVREAISLLHLHGGTPGGPTARGGRFRPRPRPLEEARDSILAKLEAIEAMRRLEAGNGDNGDGRDGEDGQA
ncbi:MAG TPA: hypothetical protein VI168_07215 [Croceibacterium sp.]